MHRTYVAIGNRGVGRQDKRYAPSDIYRGGLRVPARHGPQVPSRPQGLWDKLGGFDDLDDKAQWHFFDTIDHLLELHDFASLLLIYTGDVDREAWMRAIHLHYILRTSTKVSVFFFSLENVISRLRILTHRTCRYQAVGHPTLQRGPQFC